MINYYILFTVFVGFFVRESEEVIFRALEGEGKLCYSGDMFDNWIYFSPVEMKGKDWYTRVCIFIFVRSLEVFEVNHYASIVPHECALEHKLGSFQCYLGQFYYGAFHQKTNNNIF